MTIFKIGDKVQVKTYDIPVDDYGRITEHSAVPFGWVYEMVKTMGKFYTIDNTAPHNIDDNFSVHLNNGWWYRIEDLIKIELESELFEI